MKTFSYTNSNGDRVLVDMREGIIEAVYLFGVNILNKLTEKQLWYVYEIIR